MADPTHDRGDEADGTGDSMVIDPYGHTELSDDSMDEAPRHDGDRRDPENRPFDGTIEPGSPQLEHVLFVLLGIGTTFFVLARGFGLI